MYQEYKKMENSFIGLYYTFYSDFLGLHHTFYSHFFICQLFM